MMSRLSVLLHKGVKCWVSTLGAQSYTSCREVVKSLGDICDVGSFAQVCYEIMLRQHYR
ncbi:rCG44002, isoform CRA_b [Rattus norvegicus]|uniref:RCG44002, isoform CRA_b n=1 Tax=Rattus norvegicus TaxID=10116 RepID=A6J773_RAT|nr:rCG44002, isoform CRA_b [Rattus norvegicus]